MNSLESAIMSRGDDLRERIVAAKRKRQSCRDWTVGQGLELTRLVNLYSELLIIVEKHERIAQLARVLATECA